MMLQRMEGGGSWYQEQQNPFGGMPVGGNDLCMKCLIANMACSCCCPGSGVNLLLTAVMFLKKKN